MNNPSIEECPPILIEFTPRPGVEATALFRKPPKEYEEKSRKALDKAMGTIEQMACRVSALYGKIPLEFTEAQFEFGVTFDWETGVLLAKASTGASIKVTLTWSRPQTD